MQTPVIADRQQQVWPLQAHPPQRQLGQVQVVPPDAFVASMHVQPSEPLQLGFMCGSLPVPTVSPPDITSTSNCTTEAALIPAIGLQTQRAAAPRYRVLPTETDLNMPPSDSFQAEPNFPVAASHEAAGLCKAWGGNYLSQPLARKCEALAVNALAGYGDEIDVVAPVDILKQIFKTPYSKARISVAVHRIGRTLILNSGPDEWRDDRSGAKIARQKKSNAKAMERSLFSKFVQHSMNGDSFDSAFSAHADSKNSSSAPGFEELEDHELRCQSRSRMATQRKGKQRGSLGHCRRSRCGGGLDTLQQKSRFVGEQQRETEFVPNDCPTEGPQRPPEGFLRVLFWQFQNLRMLLGSDLLLFSNEKHAAVSLHLLEIERQVTPVMWLDAWLDNVMASIPELAVCYHRDGVVQGYELLKTDDIFLVKGLAEDGTAFFQPHVVQQNASNVLRFLRDNCKEDPGTYWLLKNAGEDLMQLFDLSVISKTYPSCGEKNDKDGGTLPSTRNCCNGHFSLPLAMLLYRLTHRLSRSKDPADRRKCAKLFGKCLEFMDEQEHYIIRASAHEHVARLILSSYEETGASLKPLLLKSSMTSGAVGGKTNQGVLELSCSVQEPTGDEVTVSSHDILEVCNGEDLRSHDTKMSDTSVDGEALSLDGLTAMSHPEEVSITSEDLSTQKLHGSLVACATMPSKSCTEAQVPMTVEETPIPAREPQNELDFLSAAYSLPKSLCALTDPVSARLEAVHHISQAIKALRWQRQLQGVEEHPLKSGGTFTELPSIQQLPLCICGEVDCVAICDFKEIGEGAQMDQKLWRLMWLLGDAYLTLGHAYKDEGQLSRALKATELACMVCGSMPQVNDNHTLSPQSHKEGDGPWDGSSASQKESPDVGGELLRPSSCAKYFQVNGGDTPSTSRPSVPKARHYQEGSFWGQLWTFVGDIYVEIQRSLGEGDVTSLEQGSQFEELTMTQEVMKEVKRLKKKIGHLRGSCGICSLTSCSCQSDRASSGDSASSCSSSTFNTKYGRKQSKKSKSKCRSGMNLGGDVWNDLTETAAENERRPEKKSISKSKEKLSSQRVYEVSEDLDITPPTPQITKEVPETASKAPSDIFTYLRRPVMVDWEANLSASVDCYSAAIGSFSGASDGSVDLELTQRKKGWACNELGRKRLALGQVKSAEVSFANAIEAFREVKDLTNIVLVHCNLGHGRRAAAEAMAAKLAVWENTDFVTPFLKTIAEAKFLYGEALKYYGKARGELVGGGEGLERAMGGLWNEVHTQLAHTYLRLGMLLSREDRFVYTCRKTSERGQLGNEESQNKKSGIKDATSTKDAITKALVIYESLGKYRAQEAAFAQYQLACHHRDSFICIATQVDTFGLKKVDTSSFHKAKLHVSLAELYWQKALDFYQPETHAEMFLDILMERSALCSVMASSFHQNQMMEQALLLLLEGRRVFVSKARGHESESLNADSVKEKPPRNVVERLTKQVQMLLKNMLAAAMMLNKPSSSANFLNRPGKNSDTHVHGDTKTYMIRTADVMKLKEMYRVILQLQDEPDLELLSNLWIC